MSNAHEEEALGKAYDSRLMRRLLAYMRPYKWRVFLALALTLAVTPLELAPPYMFKVAIDRYLIQLSATQSPSPPPATAWSSSA